MLSTSTTIGRVTLTLPPDVSPNEYGAWRRRTVSALGYVALGSGSRPPRATLIIRHLTDPEPDVLLQGQPWRAGQRWERAARSTIDAIWRTAARPIQGPIPPNAPAVWFADEAEWLACLSLDLYQGTVGQHWWWHTWPQRYGPDGLTLATLWRAEARWLPPTFALLHRRLGSGLRRLTDSLSNNETKSIQRALAVAYDLPENSALKLSQMAAVLAQTSGLDTLLDSGSRTDGKETPTVHLLALALALHAAPATVRRIANRGEQQQLVDGRPAHHYRSASETRVEAETVTEVTVASILATERRDTAATDMEPTPIQKSPSVECDTVVPVLTSESRREYEVGDTSPEARVVTRMGDSVTDDAVVPDEQNNAFALQNTVHPTPIDESSNPGSLAEAIAGTSPELAPGTDIFLGQPEVQEPDRKFTSALLDQPTAIETSLGGVWFLVNVILDLELLVNCPVGIHPWRLLDHLARGLLGDVLPDPLWHVLAALADSEELARGVPSAHLTKWLGIQRSACQAWLTGRLGDDQEIRTVLVQPARLYITRTHVDVIFGLEQIQIAARRTGLDRDPGWFPEFGRVFTFHFE